MPRSCGQPRSFSFGKRTQNHVHPGRPHCIVPTQGYSGQPNSQNSNKVRLMIGASARLADLKVMGRWEPLHIVRCPLLTDGMMAK